MTQTRSPLASHGFFAAAVGVAVLVPTLLMAQEPAEGVRAFIVGRNGWENVAGETQSTVRGDLIDPADLSTAAGFVVLSCDGRGYQLHFAAGRNSRIALPEPLSDGYVHFTFATRPAPERVSLYVKFLGPLSFQSAEPIDRSGSAVGRFFELLLTDVLTVTAVVSPRLGRGQFQPDLRLRLIFDPAPVTGVDRQTALTEFAGQCARRKALLGRGK